MKIGIIGISGRMGKAIADSVLARGHSLAGAVTRSGSEYIGRDVGEFIGQKNLGIKISDDADALFTSKPDAVIDFTNPQPTIYHASLAARYNVPLVSGTTGLDAAQMDSLKKLAEKAPILWSANMSVGVNILLGMVEKAASVLGDDFDAEIVEMHHRHKFDAPSGTALALGRSLAAGRGVKLDDVAVYDRSGAREAGKIGFAVLRGGDVVGDHTVMFAGEGERLEFSHKASSRAIFARGAVLAAEWLAGKPAGFYSMKDALNI